MRKLNKIIVHCSASDIAGHDNIDTIRKWHVDERGWKDVGYHFFIRKDGTIEKGRDVRIAGAHCKGHNHDSIGICLSGKSEFTLDQYISLGALLQVVQFEYGDLGIYPHNHFNKGKTCPNFDSKLFDKAIERGKI
jgi:N-acetyl-anhydromuramyl-L-alanine amidase AmpD